VGFLIAANSGIKCIGGFMENRCAMTGRVVEGCSDAIWDDGEWISWEWMNEQLHEQELGTRYPNADTQLVEIFEALVHDAVCYKQHTGRYLPIFGELGEIFAEITFGIKRHKPRTQGSDGRLGNDYIEIKTITPEKKKEVVSVKRQGNFNKLLAVKISETFDFEARIVDRKNMSKGDGKVAKVSWSSMKVKNILNDIPADS
tara:strand:+ start:9154 stop:9756 length:603 start_codon:yes stop_codon:yes gene_type:complete